MSLLAFLGILLSLSIPLGVFDVQVPERPSVLVALEREVHALPEPAKSVPPKSPQEKKAAVTVAPVVLVEELPGDNPPAPSAPAAAEYRAQIETKIHALVNSERTSAGKPALALNPVLSSVAYAHSADMLSNNYFSHTSPSGCGSSCRVTNAGYSWRAVGENIYWMSGYKLTADEAAEKIVFGWMNSPGHRANILSDNFTEEGIGVAVSGTKVCATQDFGKPR